MSLEAGAERIRSGVSFFSFLIETKQQWESGKRAFRFPLFRASSGLWEWGNRESDFQGLWEARETWVWFSALSIARHFHSPPVVSSCATLVLQASEQLAFGFLHLGRRLGIGFLGGRLCQLIHSKVGTQEPGQGRQVPQDFIRRRVPSVCALLLAFGCHGHLRYPARPVEVQIGIELLAIELIESFRMRRGDVAVADVFADHPTVFRSGESCVLGVARPGLGLLGT